MKNPEVTVIVPSYNPGHFLELTLASIAAQTFNNFECIIIDDCSTDDSLQKAKRHFADKRFKLIKHKVNSGASAARNTGIRAARGEFVAFLDADDLMMPDAIQSRLATCRWAKRTSDRFAGSYCGSVQIDESHKTPPPSKALSLEFVTFVSSSGNCPFNMNQPMVRLDVLKMAGGFNHELSQAEDFDFWLRILRAGYMFAPAKTCSVTYRKRTDSMVRRQPISHLDNSLSIINSAEMPLRSDQLTWSPYRMRKSVSSYIKQHRKINRIFEFIGMNLASQLPDSIESICQLVNRELPDLRLLLHSEKLLEGLIHSGIRRQRSITGAISENDALKAHELLTAVDHMMNETAEGHDDPVEALTVYSDDSKDRPWYARLQNCYQLIFVPHKAYHVWTISLIANALGGLGVRFITVDVSAEWREAGVRDEAAKNGLELISMSEFMLGDYKPWSIVTFNDWDPVTRPIVFAAKAAGINTIAIVEGIQDYDDADVHWRRYTYKSSDVVLLPGDFDKKYFANHDAITESVGVPRIEALRLKEKRFWSKDKTPRVLINCNFSYGVLVEHRDQWVTDSVEAVLALGMIPVISRHPADVGKLYPEFVTSASFYDEIETCDLSIQRFASGVLEALARDIGVIYYNPHGEKVDKFQADPMGSYVLSFDKEDLKKHLADWWNLHEMAVNNGSAFLDHHAGHLGGAGAIEQCALALKTNMGVEPSLDAIRIFRHNLSILDIETVSFSQVRLSNNDPIFSDPNTAIEKLLEMGGQLHSPLLNLGKVSNNKIETREQRTTSPYYSLLQAANIKDQETTFLLALTSQLLLDGAATLSWIDENLAAKSAINRSMSALPADNKLVCHFNDIIAFYRSKNSRMTTDPVS